MRAQALTTQSELLVARRISERLRIMPTLQATRVGELARRENWLLQRSELLLASYERNVPPATVQA
jgi:hypothetical protein